MQKFYYITYSSIEKWARLQVSKTYLVGGPGNFGVTHTTTTTDLPYCLRFLTGLAERGYEICNFS
jgi:outer membrane translocation and assembly module TamA